MCIIIEAGEIVPVWGTGQDELGCAKQQTTPET